MTTYESTISLMSTLPEKDLLKIKEFVSRLISKPEERTEMFNPYKHLTREEVIEQLAISRSHAEDGRTMDAHVASAGIREKYGL